MWGVRKLRPCSWTHKEKSKVESCEHQDDANIHCQPFPEMVSEEHNIYTDYDGYHRHHVKHYSYLSAHFSQPSEKKRAPPKSPCAVEEISAAAQPENGDCARLHSNDLAGLYK